MRFTTIRSSLVGAWNNLPGDITAAGFLEEFPVSLTLILAITLANCVRDESCREKLAPTSPIGFNIKYAAVNSVH